MHWESVELPRLLASEGWERASWDRAIFRDLSMGVRAWLRSRGVGPDTIDLVAIRGSVIVPLDAKEGRQDSDRRLVNLASYRKYWAVYSALVAQPRSGPLVADVAIVWRDRQHLGLVGLVSELGPPAPNCRGPAYGIRTSDLRPFADSCFGSGPNAFRVESRRGVA